MLYLTLARKERQDKTQWRALLLFISSTPCQPAVLGVPGGHSHLSRSQGVSGTPATHAHLYSRAEDLSCPVVRPQYQTLVPLGWTRSKLLSVFVAVSSLYCIRTLSSWILPPSPTLMLIWNHRARASLGTTSVQQVTFLYWRMTRTTYPITPPFIHLSLV